MNSTISGLEKGLKIIKVVVLRAKTWENEIHVFNT